MPESKLVIKIESVPVALVAIGFQLVPLSILVHTLAWSKSEGNPSVTKDESKLMVAPLLPMVKSSRMAAPATRSPVL